MIASIRSVRASSTIAARSDASTAAATNRLSADLVAGGLGTGERDVGHDRVFEEVAAGEADRDRVADATGADDEDAHRCLSYRNWSV